MCPARAFVTSSAPTTSLLHCTLLLVLVHFAVCFGQVDDAIQLADSIIPPWVDAYRQAPNIFVELSFVGTLLRENGQLYTLNQTQNAPFVRIFGPDFLPDAGYTFIILDVDAFTPAHPVIKPLVHWIVSNIHASNRHSQSITETGTIVLNYLKPLKPVTFPPPYGIHRYYNLLFKQPSRHENIMNIAAASPAFFSTRNFTDTYKLGYPVAGNVFKVNLDV